MRLMALLFALAAPAAAFGTTVRTVDVSTFLEGAFAGEALRVEIEYPLPIEDPVYFQLDTREFSARLSFLDIVTTDYSFGHIVNVFYPDLSMPEVHLEFPLDPGLNTGKLCHVSIDPGGGFYASVVGATGLCEDIVSFGESGRDVRRAFTRTVEILEPIPLPATMLLLGGWLMTVLAIRARARNRMVIAARA
jgi:hypothetical protein